MKSKNEIIYNMCMKVRHNYGHDYGHDYVFDYTEDYYGKLFSHLTPEDKQKIWNDMEQIYENFIHGQEELGEEFEHVLYNNLWKLYQE